MALCSVYIYGWLGLSFAATEKTPDRLTGASRPAISKIFSPANRGENKKQSCSVDCCTEERSLGLKQEISRIKQRTIDPHIHHISAA